MSHRTLKPSQIIAITAFVCLLASLGCGQSKAAPNAKAKAEAAASQTVERYAQEIADALGKTELTKPAVSAAACEGKRGELSESVFYVQGAYQLPVAPGQHLAALSKARAYAAQHGLTVKRERTFRDGATGELVATDSSGYTITLESAQPPTALALFIHSPCYPSPNLH